MRTARTMRINSPRLHTESVGSGADVFMIHGWGMHSGVWRDFARSLADRFRVTLVDLPGHGRSGTLSPADLNSFSRHLISFAPPHAHWLGWSLGATIALKAAEINPKGMASLCLVAGNARFTRDRDWPWAMDPSLLDQFAGDMMTRYHETLNRFLALQTAGLENARGILKALRECVAECEPPDENSLRAGLEMLHDTDLRPALTKLRLPLLVIMGGRDRLAPKAAGPAMCQLAAHAEMHILESAGHVPFLTHPKECAAILTDFWNRHVESL